MYNNSKTINVKFLFVASISACVLLITNCKKAAEIPIVPSELDSVPRYLGVYSAKEDCSVGGNSSFYSMKITKSKTGDNTVLLSDLGPSNGSPVMAKVSKFNIIIPEQIVTSGTKVTNFSGSGTFSEGTKPTINIDFNFWFPGESAKVSCKGVAVKE